MRKPEMRRCLDLIRPYVPGKPVEEVERELGLKNVIKLASNENPLGPSPLALQALQQSLNRLHIYPDGNCFYLKAALAEKLSVEPAQIIFGNGSDELLSLLTATYINPGDEAVAVRPSFSEYEFAMRVMGGVLHTVPLRGGDFAFDLDALAAALNERTRLIFVCSPNNPTGSVVSRDELDRFLAALPPGILVVLDEAYYEYMDERARFSTLEYVRQCRPVIILRTFSKIYGLAGLRIGYGIAPAPVIADLNRVREPFNVNSAAQTAAAAALKDDAHLQRSRALVEAGRRQLALGLAELGLTPVPTQANFYFVDTKTDSKQVFEALLRRGVIVRTGDIFGFPTYIRVTIGTAEQNELFLKNLAAVL
ncbi:MAG: histidinol-phosphate transaminase [Bacillota bacterium]